MKENGKKYLVIGAMLLAAFLLWTVLVQVVDIQPVGPKGTEVGIATLNPPTLEEVKNLIANRKSEG